MMFSTDKNIDLKGNRKNKLYIITWKIILKTSIAEPNYRSYYPIEFYHRDLLKCQNSIRKSVNLVSFRKG